MSAHLDPTHIPGEQDRPPAATVRGYPAELLGAGVRRFLTITTVLSSIVALTHQLLTSALASRHEVGLLGASHALLVWPSPLVQPTLAGVAALVLIAIGIDTHGWRQATRRQCWYLVGFVAAAVLGAGPMVLLVTITVVFFTLAIGIALVAFLVLLALLAVTR